MVEANTKNRKKGENGGHITVYGLRMKMEQAGTILKSKQTNQISAQNDVSCAHLLLIGAPYNKG